MPESSLKKAVANIEIGKYNAEKAKLLAEQVEILKDQVATKEEMIRSYVVKSKADSVVVQSFKDEVKNLTEQLAIAKKEMLNQNKLFRRQKRKSVFIMIAGPVLTAAAILYLK